MRRRGPLRSAARLRRAAVLRTFLIRVFLMLAVGGAIGYGAWLSRWARSGGPGSVVLQP